MVAKGHPSKETDRGKGTLSRSFDQLTFIGGYGFLIPGVCQTEVDIEYN